MPWPKSPVAERILGKAAGKRKPQILAIKRHLVDPRPRHIRLETTAHGFDLRQFGHRGLPLGRLLHHRMGPRVKPGDDVNKIDFETGPGSGAPLREAWTGMTDFNGRKQRLWPF